ncbi:MAG: hypothetical protein GXX90_04700 [Microbacteriaceae bacterium]|nr:hypothetical protein [Microbacteriaceae bacterium]
MLAVLRAWPARRWFVALSTAAITYLVIAIPTVLIPNPWFAREIPPTIWAQPVAIVSSVLAGMLTATYVRSPLGNEQLEREGRAGLLGGVVTFFAVGCPVCNKLVLLALGWSGAMQFFAPVQPLLAAASIALLAWALVRRMRGEIACEVPARA